MDEVLEYKVSMHEEQIKSLRQHAHEVNLTLTGINAAMDLIKKTFHEHYERLVIVSERVKKIEEDSKERKIKLGLVKASLRYWPYVLVVLAILSALDINQLVSLIKKLTG